ncbi:DUF998 domain-containing protein [Nitratireductor kimnyeongensis]|uniref:DUF998 domain-containing protein n=1 Tax=Nitratireductor kimnyeongensis TaxID=430679 RepID=A0ABW0T6D0_9HYPH|nr:DUF998 domain-containing protein [Nitratireductor kimnyeongensis]QZZ34195.1 DUF998 domain-containing protein [Nitratireductor kimnyeongensis]
MNDRTTMTGLAPDVKSMVLAASSGAAFLLLIALHLLRRDLDPTWVFLSDYMLGNWGWLMRLAFMAMALALGSSAVILAALLGGWVRWLVSGLLGLAAFGMVVGGTFPPDPTGTPIEALTGTGTLHMIGASLDFTPIAALIGSIALARQSGWRGAALGLLATSLFTVVVMVAFVISMPPDHVFGHETRSALIGRMQWASYFTWFVALAFVAYSGRPEDRAQQWGIEP